MINSLLGSSQENVLPPAQSSQELADSVIVYFHEKVSSIRSSLDEATHNGGVLEPQTAVPSVLSEFRCPSQSEVQVLKLALWICF